MSIFRPSARVIGPGGEKWEVYAYRFRFRQRGATYDPGLASDDPVGITAPTVAITEFEAGLGILDAVVWAIALIPRLLVRILWDLPWGSIHALKSNTWTVEAISWHPHRVSHTWTTDAAHHREVVAQVKDHLARGEQPRPFAATYLGGNESYLG